MRQETKLAWHWTNGKKLRDGSALPRKRRWLRHAGKIEICRSGLHASESLLDAMRYAPGLTLHRVQVRQIVDSQSDKLVAGERMILKSADMPAAIVKWAQECANLARWFAVGANAASAANAAAHAAAHAANAAAHAAAHAACAAAGAAAHAAANAAARTCIEARLIELFEEVAG